MAHPAFKQDTHRQLRVAAAIRRALGEIFVEASRFHPNLSQFMLSITNVKMSPDLKLAKVYVMPMATHKYGPQDVLPVLQDVKNRVRQALAGFLRMKFMPELRFFWDDSFENALRIETLLHDEKVQKDLHQEDID